MRGPVDRRLVGYIDTEAQPSADPSDLGSVRLLGPPTLTVREHATLQLVYTVGRFGLDDRGAMRIVMRFAWDGGSWQSEDPTAPNYVTVRAEPPRCTFRSKFEPYGAARPWFRSWSCQVLGGCLVQGDQVIITIGDTSQGSPGLRAQTFAEDAWELRFLVDVCGTGHFVEIAGPEGEAEALWRPVVPGPAASVRLVAPTRARVGEPFWLGVKAEDACGNPTDRSRQAITLESTLPVRGLPERLELPPGSLAQRIEGLSADQEGILKIVARDAATGVLLAKSNPVVLSAAGARTFWADLHGQSGETVGINKAERYFAFARDLALLDAAGHQANDFQISGPLWQHLDALVSRSEVAGRFVLLPGYEWSGNTAVGGDRNVYFRQGGRPIRRSSHALLRDRSDEASDCTDARALFEALRGEDAVAVAHVGGRWADLRYAHDDEVERAVEIHSDWGTFEWLAFDALAIGARVGVVANSDGHKGRPGASYPGAATFGAYGGLTCLTAEELSRDALFDALRARRTVATTGARLDLDVEVEVSGVDEAGRSVARGRPGDVIATRQERVRVRVSVAAGAPVHAVAVRVGQDDLYTHHPAPVAGDRLSVRLTGAKYRGRGREADWTLSARLTGARFGAVTPICLWNPDHPLIVRSEQEIALSAITTGNTVGFDARIARDQPEAALRVETSRGTLAARIDEIGFHPLRLDCGGLGMALTVARLSDHNPHEDCSFSCELPVREVGDTPIWIAVTLEDGHKAWSSPVYLHRSLS